MSFVNSLEPHKVRETVSINDIRSKILDLTKPLADIAKQIDLTIKNLQDHKEEIQNTEGTAKEISDKIKIRVKMLLNFLKYFLIYVHLCISK